MLKPHQLVIFIVIVCLSRLGAAADYSSDIQPLFAEKCLECHGPDKQKGKLRLDQRDSVLKTLEDDELIHRITTDDPDERMPPEGPPLSPAQISAITSWAKTGAPFEVHWAYQPLKVLPVPPNQNPIDHLIRSRLTQEKLSPAPEANRYTLIKRVFYDLIGLPPTPAEVDAFVSSQSPTAYADLVDQLLASPHFGERWGRHWLDKARYADSDGYEKDNPRPNAWHYRDWVITAINNDMPMDQFTIEQLAGDLLPNPDDNQKLATAFHRQTLTNTEGGTDKEEFRTEAVFDRTETTATIWLGLTMNCARCHNHKYDSILQAEYYELFDFFNHGDETNFSRPQSDEAMAKYRKNKAVHEAKLKEIALRLESAKTGHKAALVNWIASHDDKATQAKEIQYHSLVNPAGKTTATDVTLVIDQNAIVVAKGNAPDGPITYTLSAKIPALSEPVTGIRIDALHHKDLPKGGPGRVAHGNFVLSEVEASLQGKPLSFTKASADFSQGGWPAANLIDGKEDSKNGWAIAPQTGKSHWANLILTNPKPAKKDETILIKLIQNYGSQHSLGRFQVRLMTGDQPAVKLPTAIEQIFSKTPQKRSAKEQANLKDHFLKNEFPATRKIIAERDKLAKQAPKEPVDAIRVISQRATPRETHLLERGSFLTPAQSVSADVLDVLPEISGRDKAKLDRLDLARWLMSESNPLPPRVLANHVWEKLFGEGLVRTMNDFGVRGEKPEYPELLDWLGAEYRHLGWSRKGLIKTIVTSATYKQASTHRPELDEIDPNNHLLARQNRFRVEAEIARDVSLSVSGLLSKKVGGRSVYPPMPREVALLSYNNNFKWKTSEGEDRYRRGMYTFFKRTSPHPNLVAFDCPDSNTSNVKRRTSNTPIQALTMLNNEIYIEAAQAFAKRILLLKATSDSHRIEQALRFCISRNPDQREVERFVSLLEESRKWYQANPEDAAKMLNYHKAEVPPTENAAWVAMARIALNLDELITRE